MIQSFRLNPIIPTKVISEITNIIRERETKRNTKMDTKMDIQNHFWICSRSQNFQFEYWIIIIKNSSSMKNNLLLPPLSNNNIVSRNSGNKVPPCVLYFLQPCNLATLQSCNLEKLFPYPTHFLFLQPATLQP